MSLAVKIDILIPTYNRYDFVKKNIEHINELVIRDGLEDNITIIISDNCSSDNTYEKLLLFRKNLDVKIQLYKQNSNIGLEANVLFTLHMASSDHVMYCGDDDYVHKNYLKFVVESIKNNTSLGCIIPGFTEVFSDGRRINKRVSKFNIRAYKPGYISLMKNAHLGHQLSGLVFKRNKLFEKYMKNEGLRNIYPFIFFVAESCISGNTIFSPCYPVEVFQVNKKDWSYDSAGLLTEILKNIYILNINFLVRSALCFIIICQQRWRLMLGKKSFLSKMRSSYFFLIRSPYVPFLVKIFLPFIYPYVYFDRLFSRIKRSVRKRLVTMK